VNDVAIRSAKRSLQCVSPRQPKQISAPARSSTSSDRATAAFTSWKAPSNKLRWSCLTSFGDTYIQRLRRHNLNVFCALTGSVRGLNLQSSAGGAISGMDDVQS
jgi:hypothetical protein